MIARSYGVERVLVTCDDDNAASAAMIERCGGVLESIVEVAGILDDRGEPCGTSGGPTTAPGLYFIGFTHSLRGHLFEANRASRRLAQNVERYLLSKDCSQQFERG